MADVFPSRKMWSSESQDDVNTTRRPTPFMDTHLQIVDSGKYLGFNINKDLTWTKHINQNSEKASKTLGFLWRNLGRCTPDQRKIMHSHYNSKIRTTDTQHNITANLWSMNIEHNKRYAPRQKDSEYALTKITYQIQMNNYLSPPPPPKKKQQTNNRNTHISIFLFSILTHTKQSYDHLHN